ncbi:MAG: glutamine synthetase [Proteobacteria bacterium]|nr:glutamine synthetase [Pseudomonadota bacterium]
MDLNAFERKVRSDGVRFVRFLYCDPGGIIRGKAVHIDKLVERIRGGIGLTVAMPAMNMLDQLQPVEGLGPVGEIRLVPDLESYASLPYAPNSAAMMANMVTLGREPWGACPRGFLERMIARARQAGVTIQAAFEPEWTLAQRKDDGSHIPADESLCFSTVGWETSVELIDDIVAALEAQGIPVEQFYPELGHGQQELSIRHAAALRAADNHIRYRDTVRAVARQHGFVASLAPKPFADQAGNGCHIHLSAWDLGGERNLMASGTKPNELSEFGRHWIAGVLKHLPGLVALTASSYNSYRRLKPRMWSSAFRCWGLDNREASVRIASVLWDEARPSLNMELKPSDNSNNPYLALGGVIAAGLDGVAKKLDPGDPMTVDPGSLSESDRSRLGIHRLPESLAAAVDELERDEMLMEALGDLLGRTFTVVKRSEAAAFGAEDQAFELAHHFYKF